MGGDAAVALAVVVVLGAAHVCAPMLRFIRFVPRSWLLSAAGGVSAAYVFVHLLPEVAEAQSAVEERTGFLAAFERHAYLAALVGLVVFYGLERTAISSRARGGGEGGDASGADAGAGDRPTSPATFWLSTVSFALYNSVIGYLVVRRAEDDTVAGVVLFAVALGLHFIVNDLGLREHHRHRYDRFGRPLLVGALLAGWLTGTLTQLPEAFVGLAIAFLAGGVVLNVMKEELPQERQSRFVPFAVGAAAYAGLLLLP